jgi:Fe-S-cluster containining protein
MAHPDELSARAERLAYRHRLEVFTASREAAQTITIESLRAGLRLETVVAVAANLAEYADEALAIVRDEYRPPLACQEGCAHCCCKPGVLVSIPELLRLLQHVDSSFSAAMRAELVERSAGYSAQMRGRNVSDPVDESVPCPFLSADRCTVYEVRPLVCRGYNSTDADACRRAHADAAVMIPTFAIVKDVTDGATVGASQSLKARGVNDSLVDLGTALSMALANGAGFCDSVIDGSADLAQAENSTWVATLWDLVSETARQLGKTRPSS